MAGLFIHSLHLCVRGWRQMSLGGRAPAGLKVYSAQLRQKHPQNCANKRIFSPLSALTKHENFFSQI